jgi:hypothetical protein
MKRTFAPLAIVVCAVLALFFAGYSQAQQLSPGDKDKALSSSNPPRKMSLTPPGAFPRPSGTSSPLRIAGPLRNAWSMSPLPRILSAA